MFCLNWSRFSMLFFFNLFKNLNLCTSYIRQVINVFATVIFIWWKMKCNVPLNGTFHLSPHENICSIALMNIHYLYNDAPTFFFFFFFFFSGHSVKSEVTVLGFWAMIFFLGSKVSLHVLNWMTCMYSTSRIHSFWKCNFRLAVCC